MYPQTVVPSTDILHTTLTNGTDGTNLVTKLEGIYYTANRDNAAWNPNEQDPKYSQEFNEVYSYKGDRYVRVTPWAHNGSNVYNSVEGTIGQVLSTNKDNNKFSWFKVEPIKWLILNINSSASTVDAQGIVTDLRLFGSSDTTLELYAADALMSGIPFGVANHTSWEGSLINQYLNEIFYKEAFQYTSENKFNDSTIYNNNSDGTEFNSAAHGLNSNYPNLVPVGTGQKPTTQKIYLLSYYELENSGSPYAGAGKIFTNAAARQVSGTDYARAHNLAINSNTYTFYWTRTAMDGTHVYRVSNSGGLNSALSTTAHNGTRPALQLK